MNRGDQFMLLRILRIPDTGTAGGGVQKAVLRCIDDHCGGTGRCWASMTTIAEETCFARRTVIRAIADLEASKLLVVERRDGRSGSYQINWNELADLCQRVTGDTESPVTESHRTCDTESPTCDRESHKTKRNQKKPLTVREGQFEEFWKQYPPRSGKRIGKKDALAAFKKFQDTEIPEVMRAVKAYARSDRIPKDAFRWLRGDAWREWLEEPVVLGTNSDDLDGLEGEDIAPKGVLA